MPSCSLITVHSSLLPSCSSSHHHDNPPRIKAVSFAQIPSWVSLKSSATKTQNSQTTGQVENVYLVSLSKQGKLKESREFLQLMESAGVAVTAQSYSCLFEQCGLMGSLSNGRFFHEWLRRTAESLAEIVENEALKMYCDCGSLRDAQKVFDEMRERDLVCWLLIISAYAERGVLDKAVGLFLDMVGSGVRPSSLIFTRLLKSLEGDVHLEFGKQMHSYVVRSGNASGSVETAIGNMYVKCGWLEGARVLFDQMGDKKSVVAWTGLMKGYTEAGNFLEVLELFGQMVRGSVEVDEFVFSIVLKACAALEELNAGRQIHGYSVKLGLDAEVSVGTPLVDFYVKCGEFESARRAFKRIKEPNDVSWSAIISGYCQNGEFEECLKIFRSLIGKGVALNSFIYTSIFQACSAIADINLGAQVHADAIKRGLVAFLYGASAMITMYSKCGRLNYAYQAFESIDKPDTVAWTALICGYAYHGHASEALRLFSSMQNSGVKPNSVTFVAVLTACSHTGLVTDAKQYLDSMSSVYNVEPTIDHYDCMIDVYSRAGQLQEALELIKSMPFEPDAMSWKSLLGGCWIHRNLELGKFAAENLLQMDPEDTASYIIMFNLYASLGNWEEAAHFRKLMAEKNLRKGTVCSWITVKGETHRFVVGDKHHSQIDQIYSKLNELSISFKDAEDALLTEEDVLAGFPERKEHFLDHCERLAIAFGLICTPSDAPIVVFKNIRACKDCHEFAKHVSMVTRRVIIVRDSNRFHHFKSGECSCRDYW